MIKITLMQKMGEKLEKKGGSLKKRSLRGKKKEIDGTLMSLNIVKSDFFFLSRRELK